MSVQTASLTGVLRSHNCLGVAGTLVSQGQVTLRLSAEPVGFFCYASRFGGFEPPGGCWRIRYSVLRRQHRGNAVFKNTSAPQVRLGRQQFLTTCFANDGNGSALGALQLYYHYFHSQKAAWIVNGVLGLAQMSRAPKVEARNWTVAGTEAWISSSTATWWKYLNEGCSASCWKRVEEVKWMEWWSSRCVIVSAQVSYLDKIDCDPVFGGLVTEDGVGCKTCDPGLTFVKRAGPGQEAAMKTTETAGRTGHTQALPLRTRPAGSSAAIALMGLRNASPPPSTWALVACHAKSLCSSWHRVPSCDTRPIFTRAQSFAWCPRLDGWCTRHHAVFALPKSFGLPWWAIVSQRIQADVLSRWGEGNMWSTTRAWHVSQVWLYNS